MMPKQIIDEGAIAYLQKMRECGMAREVDEIYVIFVREACLTVSDIAVAVIQRDHRWVAHLSHRLKGSFYAFGAERLSDICERLENEASALRDDTMLPLLLELNHGLRTTIEEIGTKLYVFEH